METLTQLPIWQQAGLALALLFLLLLAVALRWLWRLLQHQLDLLHDREARDRQLDERLRELERSLLREQSQLGQHLAERITKGALAQQRTLHALQQQMLERTDRFSQGVERRFAEMQQRLTEDAGRLRVELLERFEGLQTQVNRELADGRLAQQEKLGELREALQQALIRHREAFDERQLEAMKAQQEALQRGMTELRKQVTEALLQHADDLGKRVQGLTETTDQRLKEISGQVEKRLSEGFEKTTETFSQVLIHLTRIDEAQKKITELSSSVVSLQEVLSDKRSRGAFGEVQLNALVRNVMPESGFSLQHTLSNGRRADCLLFLPDPTGNVVIDAKFPLESYQRMVDDTQPESERLQAQRQFRQDIKKHIDDIASKYIIEGETSDGAVMFIPAEAVFAEIHAHFPDLVEEAFRRRVWLVSPTTMMAILTTARAVLKDAATREQVHIIQEHLRELSKDFGRFQSRMDKLATHISQAHTDVNNVNISARKITGRFEKIERVELQDEAKPELPIFKE
ncbi:DNA recombination protein RmuC [Candidatus Endoriftia persephone]|jgi:DNA recombination protein RmuC|uniref:RmuC family protein n=3 Tax=Gammaproteobacteria TaxID=1236 RepID=G2FBP3_9GAMM|nr:DNA recombination protein RmuC [Candidatus Endoriftia persephone]EGV52670.1 DNA recombination protein [endosymbiont of Riftia pachyptila (vent Ph05)]EGW55724.1 RmuC family protein [endosymbiont of Tevnia jerichonana (vent Tica)]USF86290.1 DNA recombination protein RmuC [Candidatus Endoriftia persephone]